jgi:hypothetical protein
MDDAVPVDSALRNEDEKKYREVAIDPRKLPSATPFSRGNRAIDA